MSTFSKLVIAFALIMGCSPFSSAETVLTLTTTSNPSVPLDELSIMVTPLTLPELEVEAEAWMKIVQEKSLQVSATEIAIKRKNKQTKAATSAAQALETAKEAPSAEAGEALKEAQEALEETVAADADAESLDMKPDSVSDIAESAEAVQKVATEAADQKTDLLLLVTQQRDERAALSDRARIVLNEMDKKGGESATHRTYLAAIAGIDMDLTDVDSLSTSITGWFTGENGGKRWAKKLITFLGVLLLFKILAALGGKFFDGFIRKRKKVSMLLRHFLSVMVRRIIFLAGFIVALSMIGVHMAPIMAAIGAAGFVIAFALQDSLSNFASGIMILLYRPFDVGNVVETGGVTGKVASLNLVSVTISTPDNKLILVPNNKVWNDVIVNATSVKERRVDMIFGIGYQDDMDKAQTILEDIVASHEAILKDPEPVIKVNELADSSVNYICRPWVKTEDYWDVYWDVTRKVKEEFDKQGVSIPFPQQDVHIHHLNAESTDA